MLTYCTNSPIIEAYLSGVAFADSPAFFEHVVTRAQYEEGGSNACHKKFADWKTRPADEDVIMVDKSSATKERSRAKGKGRAKVVEEDSGGIKLGRTRSKVK